VPVQQLVDGNAHSLIATDPTAWFPALDVGPHGCSRPSHRAHQKVDVAQRLHARCSPSAADRQSAGRDAAVPLRHQESHSPHDNRLAGSGHPRRSCLSSAWSPACLGL
jgi:hypothetical protein